MTVALVVIGGGGHAKVLMDALLLGGANLIGICDPALAVSAKGPFGVPVLGDDSILNGFESNSVTLVNGVGSTQSTQQRQQVFELLTARGFRFATVVHPAAVIARDAVLGEGVQIMAGAIVQTGTSIGANTIINTGVRIDHDCQIGAHVHIAPSATLSGGVTIADGTHMGAASIVIQQVSIGRSCLIGAGTVVLRDLPDGTRLVSPPSRTLPGHSP